MGLNKYTQDFIVTNEEDILCKIIWGWDFIKRYKITFSTDSLSLCVDEKMVKVVEITYESLIGDKSERS